MRVDIEKHIEVPEISSRTFDERLSLPKRTTDFGWIISFQDKSEVFFLDHNLTETKCLDLGGHSQEYVTTHIALSPDKRYVALSTREYLKITDGEGNTIYTIPHHPWDAFQGSECVFTSDNLLWYVQPGNNPGEDELLKIIKPASGEVVGQTIIKNQIGFFSLYPHPSEKKEVIIDVGCGQDGSYLYRAWFDGRNLTVQNYGFDDRIVVNRGAISPDGNEFVTTPHRGDTIKIHEFNTGRVLASLDAEVVFKDDYFNSIDDPDAFGYGATFIDQQRILVDTRFGRLLLLNRNPLRVVGTVWLEGHSIEPYSYGNETYYNGNITSFHDSMPGILLVVYDERKIQLIDVHSLAIAS